MKAENPRKALSHRSLRIETQGVHDGDIKRLGTNRSAKQGSYQRRSIWQVGKCPVTHPQKTMVAESGDQSYFEKGSRSWSPIPRWTEGKAGP